MGLFRKKDKVEPGVIKCQYCGMKFDDKDRLKRHSRKAHSEANDDLPNANPFGGF